MGPSGTTYYLDNVLMTLGTPGVVTPRVDLFVNVFTPNKRSVIGDFTIAAYTGYATVTPTISAPYISRPAGLEAVDVSDAIFNGPSSGAGVDAVGWVMHDNAGTPNVYAWGLFDAALPLQLPSDRVATDATLLMAMSVFHGQTS